MIAARPTQVRLTPRLPADHQRGPFPVAPLEHDAAAIQRPVQAGRAVRHAQPAARDGIQREVLAEDMRALRVAIGNRVLRAGEGDADVCAGVLVSAFSEAAAAAAPPPPAERGTPPASRRTPRTRPPSSASMLPLPRVIMRPPELTNFCSSAKSRVANATGDVLGGCRRPQGRRRGRLLEGHRAPGLVQALDLFGELQVYVPVQQYVVLVLEFSGADVLIAHVCIRDMALVERVAGPADGVGVRPGNPQAQPRHRRLVTGNLGRGGNACELESELLRGVVHGGGKAAL